MLSAPKGRARAGLAAVVAAALLLRLGEAADRLPGWVAAWGDDAVCLPLLPSIALVIHRLAGRLPTWRLPATHGLAAVVFFGVVFELLLPALDTRATADPWDVAAYFGGWLFFQAVINVPAGIPAAPRGGALQPLDT